MKKLTDSFLGLAEPTPEENKLYACLMSLKPLQTMLEERMKPLPESNSAFAKVNDLAAENPDVETWSFQLLLADRLQQKGWPVYPQEGQDPVLCHAMGILTIQGESSRLSFDMMLAKYKKDEHAPAVTFLSAHVGELEEVISELGSFKPASLEDKHRITFCFSKNSPGQPSSQP